jgi:hypothetical protein
VALFIILGDGRLVNFFIAGYQHFNEFQIFEDRRRCFIEPLGTHPAPTHVKACLFDWLHYIRGLNFSSFIFYTQYTEMNVIYK